MDEAPTILLFGKNSYIGQCFVRLAQAPAVRIVAVSSAECNFLDPSSVQRFVAQLPAGVYSIVHLAVINKDAANSYESLLQNQWLTKNFLDQCGRLALRSLVYFSSVDVYGRSPALPITEQTAIQPDTWYGLAKVNAEWMIQHIEAVRCPVTILRIPGIYGPGRNDRSVIGRMIESLRRTGQITLNGAGTVVRDYVHVQDLCRLLVDLVTTPAEGIFNLATGRSHTLSEIVSTIQTVLGRPVKVRHEPPAADRDFDLVFDTTKLQSVMPLFHFTDLATGIRSYDPLVRFIDRNRSAG